jgi:MFS family permease
LAASAYVVALWQIVVLYGIIMTLGANCLSLVVFVPILSRSFARRRGAAISFVQSANGVGRATSAPLAEFLISGVGWQRGYLLQAAFAAVCIPPLAMILRRAELRDVGHSGGHDSFELSDAKRTFEHYHGQTLREAMRISDFWMLLSANLFTGLSSAIVSLHQFAFADAIGFDKLYAASVIGTGAFLAVVGTILIGILSDYIGSELSAIFANVVSIIGVIFALLISRPDQHVLLWAHVCFFGITWGARGPVIMIKAAGLFQGQHLGGIIGLITFGGGLGAAIGSWAAGWTFDLSGSYRIAFLISTASSVGAATVFWILRRPTGLSV